MVLSYFLAFKTLANKLLAFLFRFRYCEKIYCLDDLMEDEELCLQYKNERYNQISSRAVVILLSNTLYKNCI